MFTYKNMVTGEITEGDLLSSYTLARNWFNIGNDVIVYFDGKYYDSWKH